MTLRAFPRVLLVSAIVATLLVMSGGVRAQDARQQDHEELRALLRTITQAFSGRDFQTLAGVLDPEFEVTTVDQKHFTNLNDFRAHWEQLFQGEHALVRKVTIKPTADALTRFLGADVGLASGASEDNWEFSDGDIRVMRVRWTAVVRKLGGRWKLTAAHVGTDLLDNPVLAAARQGAWRLGAGFGLGGLVVGALGGVLLARRRR